MIRRSSAALAAYAVFSGGIAHAQTASGSLLIGCWDGTFAYTTVGLRARDDGFDLRIASQDETLFQPFFPQADLDWGQADFDAPFATEDCVVDAARAIFSCRSAGSSIALTSQEIAGDNTATHTTDTEALSVELVDVVRAGTSEPTKLLLVVVRSEGNDIVLRNNFDYPEYCDVSEGGFGIR